MDLQQKLYKKKKILWNSVLQIKKTTTTTNMDLFRIWKWVKLSDYIEYRINIFILYIYFVITLYLIVNTIRLEQIYIENKMILHYSFLSTYFWQICYILLEKSRASAWDTIVKNGLQHKHEHVNPLFFIFILTLNILFSTKHEKRKKIFEREIKGSNRP